MDGKIDIIHEEKNIKCAKRSEIETRLLDILADIIADIVVGSTNKKENVK